MTKTQTFKMTTDQHPGTIAKWVTTEDKARRFFDMQQGYGHLELVDGAGRVVHAENR